MNQIDHLREDFSFDDNNLWRRQGDRLAPRGQNGVAAVFLVDRRRGIGPDILRGNLFDPWLRMNDKSRIEARLGMKNLPGFDMRLGVIVEMRSRLRVTKRRRRRDSPQWTGLRQIGVDRARHCANGREVGKRDDETGQRIGHALTRCKPRATARQNLRTV